LKVLSTVVSIWADTCYIPPAGLHVFIKDEQNIACLHFSFLFNTGVPRHEGIVEKKGGTEITHTDYSSGRGTVTGNFSSFHF